MFFIYYKDKNKEKIKRVKEIIHVFDFVQFVGKEKVIKITQFGVLDKEQRDLTHMFL